MSKKMNMTTALAAGLIAANAANAQETNQVSTDSASYTEGVKLVVDSVKNWDVSQLNTALEKHGLQAKIDKGGMVSLCKIAPAAISEDDIRASGVNFAIEPNASFTLGKVEQFNDCLGTMKNVPGVTITKGEVRYTPSKTLRYFEDFGSVYPSTVAKAFASDKNLLAHFQYYLNSRLGAADRTISMEADQATATALASVLKNDQVFNEFAKTLETFGSADMKVLNLNGKSVLINSKLQELEGVDKEAVAILELPFFDADGSPQYKNQYTAKMGTVDLSNFASFTKVSGLDANKVRSIVLGWSEALSSEAEDISHDFIDAEKIAKTGKKAEKEIDAKAAEMAKGKKNAPTIFSGNGTLLSGSLDPKSPLGLALSKNTAGYSHEDAISTDRVSIKTELQYIYEASNQGDNSRVAAKLIMLYAHAKAGTTIYVEKGSQLQKFAVAFGFMLPNDDVLKLDYAFYKQFREYAFENVGTKKLAPEQHGVSASYTHKDLDRDALVREMTLTGRAFKVQTMNLGKIGELATQVGTMFNQWDIQGALQGGKRAELEENFALNVGKYLSEELGSTELRLDFAPRVGYTRRDAVLDEKASGAFGGGLRSKLSALFPDKVTKASVMFDGYTGGIRTQTLEVSHMFSQSFEAGIAASHMDYGKGDRTGLVLKTTKHNIIANAEEEEVVSGYPSLFSSYQSAKTLTYQGMEIDPGLANNYAVNPKAVERLVHTLQIDTSALPAGSKIEKNDNGTFKSLDLNAGVPLVDGSAQISLASLNQYLSTSGTFVVVKNLEKFPVPATYRLIAEQLPGGTFTIMSLTLLVGSVDLTTSMSTLTNVPQNIAQQYLAGVLSFSDVQTTLAGAPDPANITGVTDNMTTANDVTPDWNVPAGVTSSATINNQPYTKGTAITANGAYTLVVTTMRAGKTAVSTVHFTIDKTAPAQLNVTGFTDGATTAQDVTPVWIDPAGTSSTAKLNGANFANGATVSANGAYTLVITSTKASNGLQTVTTKTFTIDKTAPAQLNVTGFTDGATTAQDVTPVWIDPAGTSSTAKLNGANFANGATVSANGAYTLVITSTKASNGLQTVTTKTFTIDKVAPAAPAIVGPAEGVTYAVDQSATWTDPAGTTSTALLNGNPYTKGATISASGNYTLTVTSTKTANNLTSSSTVHFTIDKVAPAAPVITGVTAGLNNSAVTPDWTDPAGTTSSATLNGNPYTKGTVINAAGDYVLVVTNKKTSNNLTTPTTVNFSVDLAAPSITLPNVGTGPESGETISLAFVVSDDSAWGGQSSITFSADKWAQFLDTNGNPVTAATFTNYGTLNVRLKAPVNLTGGPDTVTTTITVKDKYGKTTTKNLPIDVAPGPVLSIAGPIIAYDNGGTPGFNLDLSPYCSDCTGGTWSLVSGDGVSGGKLNDSYGHQVTIDPNTGIMSGTFDANFANPTYWNGSGESRTITVKYDRGNGVSTQATFVLNIEDQG